MKKVFKFIVIGIAAAIVVKLVAIAIIMITMKLREFAVNTLDFLENCYKGIVYHFTTSRSQYRHLLDDAVDWDAPFEEGALAKKV